MGKLQTEFDDSIFSPEIIVEHARKLAATDQILHKDIFPKLLAQIEEIDFVILANVANKSKLKNAHYRILSIENILNIAHKNKWGLCRNLNFIYVYNGCFWSLVDRSEMRSFLGEASEKMGVPWEKARDYNFRKGLFEQFLETAHLTTPENKDSVLISLKNGIFEIIGKQHTLKGFDRNVFLTYQLPFDYDAAAEGPRFKKFLDEVLPDLQCQLVLAEYIGYLFIKGLKLEKALILYGPGANGKSVMFEIVTNLLGTNNTSNFSLRSLTDASGYYRAMLANKLVNYASEINGKLEASLFKQLVSGEPVEARLPYGNPMIISDYAKLIFNTNQLPVDVEHTHAFFRRFLIIPFDVVIPPEKQDVELARKIIETELPGVFNWVLAGLDRLISNKSFSPCDVAKRQLETFKKESDSVAMFLEDEGFQKSPASYMPLKDLHQIYKSYCIEGLYKACSSCVFSRRLKNLGFYTERKNYGFVVYVQQIRSEVV